MNIIDEIISGNLEKEINLIQQKFDRILVKNQKLESELNTTVSNLKKLQKQQFAETIKVEDPGKKS
jgi:hypothetical protein